MERTKHSSDAEVVKSAHSAIAAVDAPGWRWMMAMWEVKGGQVELTKMITNRFPTGNFLPAVSQLADACHKEMLVVDKTTINEPLPTIVPRMMMEEEYVQRVDEADGVSFSGIRPKLTAEQRQRAKETMEQAMRGVVDVKGTVEPLPTAAPKMMMEEAATLRKMMEGTEEQPPEPEDEEEEEQPPEPEDEEPTEIDSTPPLLAQPEDDDEA